MYHISSVIPYTWYVYVSINSSYSSLSGGLLSLDHAMKIVPPQDGRHGASCEAEAEPVARRG